MAGFYRDLLAAVGGDIAACLLGHAGADGLRYLDKLALVNILAVLDRHLLACDNVLDPDLVVSTSFPVELALLLVVLLALSLSVRLVGGLVSSLTFLLVRSVAFLLLAMVTLILVPNTTLRHLSCQTILLVLQVTFLSYLRNILSGPHQLVLQMTLDAASIPRSRPNQSQAQDKEDLQRKMYAKYSKTNYYLHLHSCNSSWYFRLQV